MDSLETGKDKIKKICEILKNESLEPAKDEAQKVIEVAQEQARTIIRDAENQAEQFLAGAHAKLEKERALFQTSMQQAARQGMEALRQEVENKLFNQEMITWLQKETVDPALIAKLITALVEAIEREGTSADFSAVIPKAVSAEKVNGALGKVIFEKLRDKGVSLGEFFGGARLQLHDLKMTLDLSDQALQELLGMYVRKDFRARFFQ